MTTTEAPDGRYRIAEVSRLTGFTPTTLRFYENAGVLAPPARTAAGYRIYGDRDVERLRLIARAKELGCTLEDISGLVEAWYTDECGPVKHQLRSLVNAKVADVQRHIAEQVAFAAQLQATAAALASRPLDGPCNDSCGCTTAVVAAAADTDLGTVEGCGSGCGCSDTVATMEPVTLVSRPGATAPIACSLRGGDMKARIDQWQALLAGVEHREAVENGIRLVFAPGTPLVEIARLAAAEQECCPFFAFALTIDGRGTALEVRAPADGQVLLDAVFGVAA